MRTLSPDASLPSNVRRVLPALPESRAEVGVGTIPVNDIAVAVQWLGAHGGTPAVFVRTQGCDVGCMWCDVPETWHQTSEALRPDWKRRVVRWRHLSPVDVRDWCRENYRQGHVVVTGGEPAMHASIGKLCETLLEGGYGVQFETSGTYELDLPAGVWVTVSPKFAMMGKRTVLESALKRANEIVMPVSRMADFANLAQKVAPFVPRSTPIYLHPIRAGAITASSLQSAFAQGYRVTVAAQVR